MYFYDVLICLQIDYLILGKKNVYQYFSVFRYTYRAARAMENT